LAHLLVRYRYTISNSEGRARPCRDEKEFFKFFTAKELRFAIFGKALKEDERKSDHFGRRTAGISALSI